jgi:3-oxoacyl-[acyl-carrier-protein] synthase-3
MERFSIVNTAIAVPNQVVSNNELATFMDTSDDWIFSRSRIRERHVVTTENTSDLAISVATQLLAGAEMSVTDLDFIIVATMSPDYLTPSVAAIVQGQIGATKAFAFDINAACSGYVFGLSVAASLLSARYKCGMIIGAEVLSKLVDWTDRSTAILFGDAAAGAIIVKTTDDTGLLSESLRSFGEQGGYLTAGKLANRNHFAGDISKADPHFQMDGREVYNFATREVPLAIQAALSEAGMTSADVDSYIVHQANGRIVESIAKRLGEPIEKFPMNMGRYGNTSAASVGLLLHELRLAGKIKTNQTIVLAGFGGGLTVGALVLKV